MAGSAKAAPEPKAAEPTGEPTSLFLVAKGTLSHNGADHLEGASLALTEAQAAPLLALGVLTPT